MRGTGPVEARGGRALARVPELEGRLLAWVLAAPALALLAALVYVPLVETVRLSFHRIVLVLPEAGSPFVGLENYRTLLASEAFRRSLRVTLVFVAASTAFEMVLGTGVALCMHAPVRGRGLVRAALLVPWALPTAVTSQMWRFLLNDRFGPVSYYLLGGAAPLADPSGALGAIVAADVWKTTSFVGLVVLAGLQTIPAEIYDAARVDGAGPWRRFVSITLPLVRPALLVALLFRTIDALRVFDLVFVMTQGGPANATAVLQYLGYKKMFAEGFLGLGAAISTVTFLLSLALAVAYVRIVGAGLLGVEDRA